MVKNVGTGDRALLEYNVKRKQTVGHPDDWKDEG